jgi:hypothetical protein
MMLYNLCQFNGTETIIAIFTYVEGSMLVLIWQIETSCLSLLVEGQEFIVLNDLRSRKVDVSC